MSLALHVHAGRLDVSPARTLLHHTNSAPVSQSAIIAEFRTIVRNRGLHDGLRFLNARTPHRYTGIYRYDGDMLRNVYLYDQFSPSVCKGADVKMVDAYCALVGQRQATVEFADINAEKSIAVKADSPVVSYSGALIRDDHGEPFGTLCHFDTKPSQARMSDVPLLEAIAPLIYTILQDGDPAGPAASRTIDWSTALADDFIERPPAP